jgi:hypothetical protein
LLELLDKETLAVLVLTLHKALALVEEAVLAQ